MSDLLPELEQKRELLRNMVEEHIRKRDDAADESHYYAEERDKLNQKVREMREEVKKKIMEKGQLIEKVQKMRDEKEAHYSNLAETRKEYRKIRDSIKTQGIDPKDLRMKERDLQKLELKQQTTQMKKEEEQKVVREIRRLTNELKKLKAAREDELKENDTIKGVTDKLSAERKTVDDFKKEIEGISNQINQISDEINTALQELDETRKKADEFHELFIKYNKESEKEHDAFIKAKNELRDLEKVLGSIKTKARATRKKEKEGELQEKAVTLFDKFKNGEQLTTEDLLILQKAGFL